MSEDSKQPSDSGSAASHCYAFPRVGRKAYFVKSGAIVVVVERHGDDQWTVEKMNGKRMLATTDGLRELGPFDCLCQTLHQTAAGSGCEICNA